MTDLATLISGSDALLFDCDGTLVDTPPLYARAWAAGLASAGHELEPAWYLARAGLSEAVLLDAYEREFAVTLPREAIGRAAREAFAREMPALREVAAVAAIARENHGRRPMAVASGGPRQVVEACLRSVGLLSLFDAVVTVEDAVHPKPAPDLFLEAARRLGMAPERCLVFEDSREGLEAARRAGMRAIDVMRLGDAPPAA
ncbi:HAD family hydrolase [Rhizosaccharibacter radicis]|uniref:HAD family phosphatase n=1 Tax=Rhizosaccharibacter radicis TaxID=2782605 RepID=A0ABT1VY15_9PROT|nr:HAD family phosphatase [Acetobacteraceae bacterium KSS12]